MSSPRPSTFIRGNQKYDREVQQPSSTKNSRIEERIIGTTSRVPTNRIRTSSPTAASYQTAAANGHAEGYEEGLRQGMAEAQANAEALERQFVHRVEQALAGLEAARQKFESQLNNDLNVFADELGRAVVDLAEVIVGHELSFDPTPVLSALRRAFQEMPLTRQATVYMNPQDAELLGGGTIDESMLQQSTGGRTLTIVPDRKVEPGGAIVEIGATTIDAQVSTACDRVRQALVGE